MDKSLLSSENWLEFKSKIELNFPTFFANLEAVALLRPEKVKLCSLLLLDASTAEISRRLLISKHAVHLAHISLAQKFNLTSSKELVHFLKQLANTSRTDTSVDPLQEDASEIDEGKHEPLASHFTALRTQLSYSRSLSETVRSNMAELLELISIVHARRAK